MLSLGIWANAQDLHLQAVKPEAPESCEFLPASLEGLCRVRGQGGACSGRGALGTPQALQQAGIGFFRGFGFSGLGKGRAQL